MLFYQTNLLAFGVKFCGSVLTKYTPWISHWNILHPMHESLRHGDDQTDSAAVAWGFGDCQSKTLPLLMKVSATDGVTVAWEQGLAISHAQLKQQVLWPRAETQHPPPPRSLTLSFSLCSFDLGFFFSLSLFPVSLHLLPTFSLWGITHIEYR